MNVDFLTAIKLFFANYANFNGRSTRAEFWWVALFTFGVSTILSILGLDFISILFSLAVIIPNLAISFRGFHDTGRSGWWVIGLCLASLIGAIIMYGPIVSAMIDNFSAVIADDSNSKAIVGNVFSCINQNIGTIFTGGLIATVATIWNVVILIQPSAPDNKYGPNPYGGENA